nr:protein swallow [Drosophila takahashii]
MSIQDESFPADELFDQLNNLSSLGARNTWFAEHHQPAAFERNTAQFLDTCYADADEDGDADGDADVANKSAKTCVSDPAGRDQEDEDDVDGGKYQLGGGEGPLGSGRGSKAVSYQDIHSAYTKRRFKHVKSKVAQYIADIQAEDEKRRSASGLGIQRHSSMPEYLTPTSRREFKAEMDDSQSQNQAHSQTNNSSCSEEHLLAVIENLQEDKMRLQARNDYIQLALDKKRSEYLQMRSNFETCRSELSDCQQKLRRHQSHSLRSLNSWPPAGIAKATQTEAAESSALVTPLPRGDLTYNSSEGSIEMALLSVAAPVPRIPQNLGQTIHPQSLDFSSVSTEADGSGTLAGEARGNSSSRAPARRPPAPNNSETSQPSSNDSAIEVEGNEEERPSARQWIQRNQRGGIFYFDKRSNRVIEVIGISQNHRDHNQGQDTSQSQSINDSQAQLLVHSMSQSQSQVQTNVHFRSKRSSASLGSRVLRLLGPCVRCRNGGDPTLNGSNATYTLDLSLLPGGEFRDPRNQR